MVSFSGERREKQDTGNVFFSAWTSSSPKSTMWEGDPNLWRPVGSGLEWGQIQIEVSDEAPTKTDVGVKFGPTQCTSLSHRRWGLCTGPRHAGITQGQCLCRYYQIGSPLHSTPTAQFRPLVFTFDLVSCFSVNHLYHRLERSFSKTQL